MSEIEDIAGAEFDELFLQQMHLGGLDVVDSRKLTSAHVGGTAGRRLGSSAPWRCRVRHGGV